ncbi:MAG: HD domain-containing protein [Firmicutes bacterium]|nr:HD domain-containing protein [Bacillota bacterium]
MTVAQIMEKMILFSDGNRKSINHFMKVWTYAKTIGEQEGLDEETLFVLEATAIVHDIACPMCREKYGHCQGPVQEKEGAAMVYDFFSDCGLTAEQVDRISYLVGHHHTVSMVDGPDYQILLEADYLVNSDEKDVSAENVIHTRDAWFKTETGIRLLNSNFGIK